VYARLTVLYVILALIVFVDIVILALIVCVDIVVVVVVIVSSGGLHLE
jgi:hypothetical protein